jgi:hypothetical protein
MSSFKSAQEFREVVDKTLTIIREHPDMGPRLRTADTSLRFDFTDVDMAVSIRGGAATEPNIAWEWTHTVAWEPKVTLRLSSDAINRYLQGKENVLLAVATRRITAGGDIKTAIPILSITRRLSTHYRAMILSDYPHLAI